MSRFPALLQQALAARRAGNLFRQRHIIEHAAATAVHIDGREYVNFSSNDYLGLRTHPSLVRAAAEAVHAGGAGSGASPLVTGYTEHCARAERALAAWKQTESAVLLPSGYQANHAAVQTIALALRAVQRPVRFLLDKLVHASLIDAVRATGAPMRVYPHNGLKKLERLLDEAEKDQLQVVLTESIFSMDGDAADLRGLVALKRRKPFVLLVDEAHGSGVYGRHGGGYADECGLAGEVDVFVVTLSKALGSIGGAVCGSGALCESVVNFGRAYLYSTAVPPAVPAALMAALQVLRDEPQRQQRVRQLSRDVRNALRRARMALIPGDSPIIPIVLGDETAALKQSQRLLDAGLLVLPIRPPTVAPGESRLRITLSCEHSAEQIDALVSVLTQSNQ